MRALHVARRARRDIDLILWTSHDRHGARAAERYRRLIARALTDLREDPGRPSSRSAEVGDLRLYALRIAARGMPPTGRESDPPHVIAYRFDEARVEIVRILHEAMDLPAHLR